MTFHITVISGNNLSASSCVFFKHPVYHSGMCPFCVPVVAASAFDVCLLALQYT